MKKKILIVDDDPRNIFALKLTLKSKGYDVRSSLSGDEAITMLKDEPDIKVILMDMMMPDMDGYQTMKNIRKTELRKPCRKTVKNVWKQEQMIMLQNQLMLILF